MVVANLLLMILDKLSERKNRLLQTAKVGLPESQYDAYRTILLDELGRKGFEKDLEEVLMQYMERNGTGRRIYAGKEVPK
ncbi:MAG: hypothetical protein WAT68_10435 [Candidatus Nitrotoga sp.]